MNQEHIKKIREAVIKANPSILDLELGCEYESCLDGAKMKWIDDQTSRDIGKIIGRPIRLADVLLAINQVLGINNVAIEEYGVFMQTDNEGWGEIHDNDKRVKWILKDDNLENQSEDCINFLYQLLKEE